MLAYLYSRTCRLCMCVRIRRCVEKVKRVDFQQARNPFWWAFNNLTRNRYLIGSTGNSKAVAADTSSGRGEKLYGQTVSCMPDRTFHNFRVSRTGDFVKNCSSEMSCDEFWSSNLVKGSVGWGLQSLWQLMKMRQKLVNGNYRKWANG